MEQVFYEILKSIPALAVMIWALQFFLALFREEVANRREITSEYLKTMQTVSETTTTAITLSTEQTRARQLQLVNFQTTQSNEHHEVLTELRALTRAIEQTTIINNSSIQREHPETSTSTGLIIAPS